MKTINLMNIKNITLEEAIEIYKLTSIGFIIRDGKLKGMNKN